MLNSTVIVSEPESVSARLPELGLREEILLEAIYQAHLYRTRLTPNHPKIFPGLEMWGWAVASLREQLRPLGWEPIDVSNYALTVHKDLGIAIAIASGDENTGSRTANSSNRSRKGQSTIDAVEMNYQADMFSELLPEAPTETDRQDTWVLLHFTDTVSNELKIELSRPSMIGDDGRISAWSERIILRSVPLDGDLVNVTPPQGPDIDFEVRRKA